MALTPTVPWFNCFKIIKGSRDTHRLDQISYLIYYSQETRHKVYYEKLSSKFKLLCYVHELTLRVFLYFLKWMMYLHNDLTAFMILT